MLLTGSGSNRKRAVAYYRHSAEDKQENSVAIQREHVQKFATQHGVEVIHEEADEGKTGLLADRPGFQRILNEWVINPYASPFEFVLVYDVSRWGRFQNQDEAAHYAFLCKKNGKEVIYTSRGFLPKSDEPQLISNLQTTIERYMAAEYSRQLSEKVFRGSVKVSEQGYSAGGTPCYGMVRVLLDVDKKPIRILKRGEHKSIDNERVTFDLANDAATACVRKIFDLFVSDAKTPRTISRILNDEQTPSPAGKLWDERNILHILANETYIGSRIYNKKWGRLKQKTKNNPRSEWVIKLNAFPALIEKEKFKKAQERVYWLTTSRWRKGEYFTDKMERTLRSQMASFLAQKGFDEDTTNEVMRRFPLIVSIRLIKDSIHYWCFVFSESVKRYSSILGVGLTEHRENPVDVVFAIPTQDFSASNFALIPRNSDLFARYAVPADQIESRILTLSKEITSSR